MFMLPFEVPAACAELIQTFDRLNVDYLTLCEQVTGDWKVEGYLVYADCNNRDLLVEIDKIVAKYNLITEKTSDGLVIYKQKV